MGVKKMLYSVELEEVGELGNTARGTGGFGSTGA
jgi:dUTPase